MSWTPSSWGGGGSTPPNVNKSLQRIQGMGKLVGIQNQNQNQNQQLLPAGAVKQRFLGSQGTSSNGHPTPIQQSYWNRQKGLRSPLPLQESTNEATRIPPHRRLSKDVVHSSPAPHQTPVQEVVRKPFHQSPEIVDSEGTDDFEHSSVGTWNSPKEQSIGNNSSEFEGAPLPAPLHIIQAVTPSTALVLRQRSLSTASMALSAGPLPSDETAALNSPEPHDHENDEDMALVQVHPNLSTAVEKWETQQESYPFVNLTANRHPRVDDCDIDPATGKLIPPPRYIKIQKDTQAKHNWRRAVTNSEGYIARELDLRKSKKEEIERKKEEQKYADITQEEDKWPDVDCTLRPVQPEDFQRIANIVNNEMQREDSQVYLPKVDSAQIAELYNACTLKRRPFIVAIESSCEIVDRSGWSKGDEKRYQKLIGYMKSHGVSESPTILGFAFVDDSRHDFLGHACQGARFSGKIKLIVDPEHRQMLVGSALLDRIMLSTSIYHRSLVDYTWKCSEPRKTYEEIPAHNERKYSKLYLETLFNGEDDSRIEWMTRLLEKYDFAKVGNFKEAVKHGRNPGVWKDLVVWEHEVRPASEIVEDDRH
ncbi:acyl n-acyltransferase [Fusarium mexicanum]|uniref:Acyl n-acyltransferase n=1 Tax=Fusarium mexicanum TaxID=751941 RepID=A0A8H5IDF8_9HYPO|nr:acyl n-acyltransferase [Fusarium mexicanum]